MKGICDGMNIVITTVGLTTSSRTVTHYDIDLNGNLAILAEARSAKVKKFIYTSVIKVDSDPSIPMLDAKNRFEIELKESGLDYMIFRPSGYFYDIARVFRPMIEKGTVTLLKGVTSKANVIDTSDLAEYILEHMNETNETIEIGGRETYTYEEITEMFFAAAGKTPQIRYAPGFLFDILAFIARVSNNGRYANIRFGKWTLTHDMEARVKAGKKSFKEYISHYFQK